MRYAIAIFVTFLSLVGAIGSLVFVTEGGNSSWWTCCVWAAATLVCITALVGAALGIGALWEWAAP